MNRGLIDHRKHQDVVSTEAERVATRIAARFAGQLRSLRILIRQNGFVLQGYVGSYYAKQLVQEAVRNSTEVPIVENAIEVVSLS